MSVSLLKTKLFLPQICSDLVSRSRLLARLQAGMEAAHKLTLVSAPAGFGKSTLLSHWASQCAIPVAWLSLDEHDNDEVRFWVYVLKALQSAEPGLGEIALAMLNTSPQADIIAVLTSLINQLTEQSRSVLVVLDDYQFIQLPAIHKAVTFLLENAPAQLYVALATRIDPPLNLARLRVRDQMTELRANDLRFTGREAATFLNDVMQLGLSPDDVLALETRTEGWIAGLRVAAMAMRNREDVAGFVAAFTGSHRHVLSYLVEEVFSRQAAPVQRFLLQTSILDRLCGSLCDALTGQDNGQAMLERLERDNLFIIALDDEQRWYRYHHLFRDVLRARHQRLHAPEAIADLHRQASLWYEREGSMHQAVHHALQIEDFGRVAGLLNAPATEMIGHYGLTTLQHWMDGLPDALVRKTANLSMAYAWIFLASSQTDQVEPHLQDVERALGVVAGDTEAGFAASPEVRCTLAEVLSIRSNAAFHGSDLVQVLAFARQALGYLDDECKTVQPDKYAALQGIITFNMGLAHNFTGDVREATKQFQTALHLNYQVNNWHLIPVAASYLAQTLQTQGKLNQAAEIYRRAIRYTEQSDAPPSPLSGIAHAGLGQILYEFNELAEAEACLQQGLTLAQAWTHWETLVPGTLALSRIKAAQGEWGQADTLLQDLAIHLPASQGPWQRTLLKAQQAWLQIQQGHLDAVKSWLQETDLRADSDIVYLREAEFIILAQAYIAVNEPQQAISLLERLCAGDMHDVYVARHIQCLTLTALAQSALSQQQRALKTLQRALVLAAPEGYVRLLVDMGASLLELLTPLRVQPDVSTYVKRLLSAFPQVQSDSMTSQPLVEPLSERELELLHLIATGMTNHAIADKLIVSINTVKTHARNIYSKLGVRNRTEAVSKARALGLMQENFSENNV